MAWSSSPPATCCAPSATRAARSGAQVQAIMDAGKLVSDEIMIALIAEPHRPARRRQGLHPRRLPAHRAAGRGARRHAGRATGSRLDQVIELKVDEAALVERIAGRFTCAKCGASYHERYNRPKQDGVCDVCGSQRLRPPRRRPAETVKARLAAYRDQTAPILPYYRAKGLLRSVDGMADIDEVTQRDRTDSRNRPTAPDG